jgi:hypothetical protein
LDIRRCRRHGTAWNLSETFMIRPKFKSQLFAGLPRICSSTYIQGVVTARLYA